MQRCKFSVGPLLVEFYESHPAVVGLSQPLLSTLPGFVVRMLPLLSRMPEAERTVSGQDNDGEEKRMMGKGSLEQRENSKG